MRAARELAGGDSGRIIVQRDGSVLVAAFSSRSSSQRLAQAIARSRSPADRGV
jgi:hypothetical protein